MWLHMTAFTILDPAQIYFPFGYDTLNKYLFVFVFFKIQLKLYSLCILPWLKIPALRTVIPHLVRPIYISVVWDTSWKCRFEGLTIAAKIILKVLTFFLVSNSNSRVNLELLISEPVSKNKNIYLTLVKISHPSWLQGTKIFLPSKRAGQQWGDS